MNLRIIGDCLRALTDKKKATFFEVAFDQLLFNIIKSGYRKVRPVVVSQKSFLLAHTLVSI
jgi:hypothetical protein